MPDAFRYEFGGPVGAFANLFALPGVIYGLYFLCSEEGCLELLAWPPVLPSLPAASLWSWRSFVVVVAWLAFQALLALLLPGPLAWGVRLPPLQGHPDRLPYRLNGFLSLLVSLATVLALHAWGLLDLAYCYHHFAELISAACAVSLLLSLYLYASSFVGQRRLAAGGTSGVHVYDFFMGRELNPRLLPPARLSQASLLGVFDLKVFCELRPGLVGWLVLDWAMAAHQLQAEGQVGAAMLLVCLFQTWYVADALYFERAILTTMDVTTDGFGFMLAFGDLAWVPFTYSLQARYLASRPLVPISLLHVAACLLLKALGYAAFRGANSQKDQFRRDPSHPSVAHLKTLDTKRGTKLIISGWWGIARHINYVGDWLMAWAWCLPCGFDHLIPYFYVIYFGILLVHRDLRDEHSCIQKYGADWKRYCSIVRYRFIPYVY